MKITILGTGTFYVNTERSGPAYLLEADGKKILVDCGPGTLMRLSQIGVKPDDLDFIFLSHLHADHTSDLFALQMNFRLKDFFSDEKEYKTPVIYGPLGIDEFTKKLSYLYQLPAFDNYSKIEYLSYTEEIKIDNLTVRTFKVSHGAFGGQADAYALRFECEGKIFTFSGDSIKCEGVEKAAKDADVFICDASYEKGKGSPAHMDSYEIGEIAEKSNVKSVYLTHFYPNENIDNLVTEVREKYQGIVIPANDLLEISI